MIHPFPITSTQSELTKISDTSFLTIAFLFLSAKVNLPLEYGFLCLRNFPWSILHLTQLVENQQYLRRDNILMLNPIPILLLSGIMPTETWSNFLDVTLTA